MTESDQNAWRQQIESEAVEAQPEEINVGDWVSGYMEAALKYAPTENTGDVRCDAVIGVLGEPCKPDPGRYPEYCIVHRYDDKRMGMFPASPPALEANKCDATRIECSRDGGVTVDGTRVCANHKSIAAIEAALSQPEGELVCENPEHEEGIFICSVDLLPLIRPAQPVCEHKNTSAAGFGLKCKDCEMLGMIADGHKCFTWSDPAQTELTEAADKPGDRALQSLLGVSSNDEVVAEIQRVTELIATEPAEGVCDYRGGADQSKPCGKPRSDDVHSRAALLHGGHPFYSKPPEASPAVCENPRITSDTAIRNEAWGHCETADTLHSGFHMLVFQPEVAEGVLGNCERQDAQENGVHLVPHTKIISCAYWKPEASPTVTETTAFTDMPPSAYDDEFYQPVTGDHNHEFQPPEASPDDVRCDECGDTKQLHELKPPGYYMHEFQPAAAEVNDAD